MMTFIRRSRSLVLMLFSLAMVAVLAPAGAAPALNSAPRQQAEASSAPAEQSDPLAPAATVWMVTGRTDSGAGSLRQALLNAQAGDTIRFDTAVFPPENPASITLLAALPELSQGNLTIDASNAGVILDGSLAPAGTHGLRIVSAGNIIKGLQIVHFPGSGIYLYANARNNLIGGNWQIGDAARGEGNIITGNGAHGVEISGSGALSNTVRGNLIGLDANGTQDFRVQSLALSPNFATDRTGFLSTRYQGVLKTTNGGTTWSAVNNGLTILDVRDLAASPSYQTDHTLFAGTASGGIFKSTNGGAAWVRLDASFTDNRDVRDLALSPNYASDRLVMAVLSVAGLFASTDGGALWGMRRDGMETIGGSPSHRLFASLRF
ncbi:MAG: hypothetical protein IPO15_22100 [Anaerolineae bacterium]|uniref:hypothetical protein n=1 Tax=Candidatus Amarolinea dominans TaxID=3140696 RepID=UPI0031354D1F|nr:hypothetical protein [Anaerolineae bacterium]